MIRWPRRGTAAVAAVVALVTAAGCRGTTPSVADADPPAARPTSAGPGTVRVPADAPTISAAVAAARPGDLVLVSPGTYRETVAIDKDGVTLRGTDRNAVVIDGEVLRANGVVVTADRVTVENLTVRNATLNGVLVTGMADAGGGLARGSDGYTRLDPARFPPIDGFAVRSVTAYDNGLYGVYAFDSRNGVIEGSYASGSADSGIYVGQCRDCGIVVRGNVAERNAVGYEGTNASGRMWVVGNRFSHNRVGLTSNSDYQEAFVPQQDAVIAGNVVADNAEPATPEQADGGWGVGIGLAGSRGNLVLRNRVSGNPGAGVAIASVQDLAPVGNQVRENSLSGNGTDLAYAASATAPGAGNCLSGPGHPTTLPARFASCPPRGPAPGGPVAGKPLVQPTAPPGIPFPEVAAPPPQPSQPSPASAPFGPATAPPPVDVSAVAVPPPDLLGASLLDPVR